MTLHQFIFHLRLVPPPFVDGTFEDPYHSGQTSCIKQFHTFSILYGAFSRIPSSKNNHESFPVLPGWILFLFYSFLLCSISVRNVQKSKMSGTKMLSSHSIRIILFPQLGITQDLICLSQLLKLSAGLRIILILVWMQLQCHLIVILLDLRGSGIRFHLQNIVETGICHLSSRSGIISQFIIGGFIFHRLSLCPILSKVALTLQSATTNRCAHKSNTSEIHWISTKMNHFKHFRTIFQGLLGGENRKSNLLQDVCSWLESRRVCVWTTLFERDGSSPRHLSSLFGAWHLYTYWVKTTAKRKHN